MSFDLYSDSSDSNSSSLHEVNICALNDTRNVELTVEREIKGGIAGKMRTVQWKWEGIKSK
jgi:hypothetical protein